MHQAQQLIVAAVKLSRGSGRKLCHLDGDKLLAVPALHGIVDQAHAARITEDIGVRGVQHNLVDAIVVDILHITSAGAGVEAIQFGGQRIAGQAHDLAYTAMCTGSTFHMQPKLCAIACRIPCHADLHRHDTGCVEIIRAGGDTIGCPAEGQGADLTPCIRLAHIDCQRMGHAIRCKRCHPGGMHDPIGHAIRALHREGCRRGESRRVSACAHGIEAKRLFKEGDDLRLLGRGSGKVR